MLRFTIPALGIYLADPIMGNIDNGFVGRFAGTVPLAAMGPGSVLVNNLVYLATAVLNSATTGLVARAWANGGAKEAREALSKTLAIALLAGLGLTIFYATASRPALRFIGASDEVLGPATAYAAIRGLSSWAVVAQGVCLSAILATRDSVTPLKVVLAAAALNFTGDFLLCGWPLRTGVAGAAAATTLSVFAGFGLMLRSLRRKELLPKLRPPTMKDVKPVLEYVGPLFIVTAARVLGFTFMTLNAAALGSVQLAAFQLTLGIFVVFAFAGAPLSQNAQSLLPALVDAGEAKPLRRALADTMVLATIVGFLVAGMCAATLRFGSSLWTTDVAVQKVVASATLTIFLGTASVIVSSSVDGALLAAKDFGFVAPAQIAACALQFALVMEARRRGLGVPWLFATFVARLWVFLSCAAVRVACGAGPLGRVVRGRS